MEPPGADVPRDTDAPALGTVRLAAAVVTVAVAAVARGPLALVAIGTAAVLASPAGAAAAGLAVLASYLRWGTGWLAAVGGAQAVLGPAVAVGPAPAAASAAVAAVALVLPTPPSVLAAVALGASAALLACGPAGADEAGVRLLATLVAVGVAYGISRLRWLRMRTVAAVALGVVSVVLAAL